MARQYVNSQGKSSQWNTEFEISLNRAHIVSESALVVSLRVCICVWEGGCMLRHVYVLEGTHMSTYRSQSTTCDIICQELYLFVCLLVCLFGPYRLRALWLGQFGWSLTSRNPCVSFPALGLQVHTNISSVFVYVGAENEIQALIHIRKVLYWLSHLASPEKMSRLHGVLQVI